MAKFLTVVVLSTQPTVQTTFEAESAREVLAVLNTMGIGFEGVEIPEEAPVTAPAKRRGRPPKSGVVSVITPEGAARVAAAPEIGDVYGKAPVVEDAATSAASLPTLAEISDAIRAYARQPGVGVPGVTALIHEFKTEAGEPAQQVKAIATSEYPALVARLAILLVK